MKKLLVMLISLGVFACDSPQNEIAAYGHLLPMGKKPFSTVSAVQTAYLSIPTTDVTDFSGEVIPAFGVFIQNDSHIYFNLAVTNPTEVENFWTGAYPNPDIYTDGVPVGLKHFIKGEIFDNTNTLVTSIEPVLYDAGETVPLSDPTLFPYHESSTFDGFWISARWANLTSANNAGSGTGTPTPGFLFPTPTLSGDYTLVVTLDPLNIWGQQTTYTVPFTVSGLTVTSKPFKTRGR